MANPPQLPPPVVVRPDPDPTILTTQQLQREVASLKELFITRLDAMDKAVALLQAFADKQPTIAVVDTDLRALGKLMEEKFASVQMQLIEREKRTTQITTDGKLALSAALDSQDKAVSKSEANFVKQIDTLGGQLGLMSKNLDDKINDIKDRFNGLAGLQTRGEGRTEGINFVWVVIAGVIGALVPATGLLISLMGKP